MAKFSPDEALSVIAVQQVINDWAYDLDFYGNEHVGGLITEDVSYNVAGSVKQGRAAVVGFYADRRRDLQAKFGDAQPVMRHINTNFRCKFARPDQAEVTFHLVFWTTEVPGFNPADIIAVADVQMTIRRGSDGDWKIAHFDSTQPLKRVG